MEHFSLAAQKYKIKISTVLHILCMNDHIVPQMWSERKFVSRKSYPVAGSKRTSRERPQNKQAVVLILSAVSLTSQRPLDKLGNVCFPHHFLDFLFPPKTFSIDFL